MGNKVDAKLLVGTVNIERETSKKGEMWWQRNSQETSPSCKHFSFSLLHCSIQLLAL